MLPKSVAEQLKLGQIVTAEYYENCTIYFRLIKHSLFFFSSN